MSRRNIYLERHSEVSQQLEENVTEAERRKLFEKSVAIVERLVECNWPCGVTDPKREWQMPSGMRPFAGSQQHATSPGERAHDSAMFCEALRIRLLRVRSFGGGTVLRLSGGRSVFFH